MKGGGKTIKQTDVLDLVRFDGKRKGGGGGEKKKSETKLLQAESN